jgi:hypothetical protein
MSNFERVGRRIDQEVDRLREVAESKFSPRSRIKTARVLHRISQRLERLAEELESASEPREV